MPNQILWTEYATSGEIVEILIDGVDQDVNRALVTGDIDATPVQVNLLRTISSNWAYGHNEELDPHTGIYEPTLYDPVGNNYLLYSNTGGFRGWKEASAPVPILNTPAAGLFTAGISSDWAYRHMVEQADLMPDFQLNIGIPTDPTAFQVLHGNTDGSTYWATLDQSACSCIASLTSDNWVTITTFTNLWENHNSGEPLRYRTFNSGLVIFEGAIKNGHLTEELDGETYTGAAFRLPYGVRPLVYDMYCPCSSNGTTITMIKVDTQGYVYISHSSDETKAKEYTSLSSLFFATKLY